MFGNKNKKSQAQSLPERYEAITVKRCGGKMKKTALAVFVVFTAAASAALINFSKLETNTLSILIFGSGAALSAFVWFLGYRIDHKNEYVVIGTEDLGFFKNGNLHGNIPFRNMRSLTPINNFSALGIKLKDLEDSSTCLPAKPFLAEGLRNDPEFEVMLSNSALTETLDRVVEILQSRIGHQLT